MQGRDLVLPDVGTAAGSPLRGARCARPRRLAAPGPASRRGPAGLRPRARRAPCRDPGALGLGPGRPSLILGPHPSRCPLAALRGHARCARWPRGRCALFPASFLAGPSGPALATLRSGWGLRGPLRARRPAPPAPGGGLLPALGPRRACALAWPCGVFGLRSGARPAGLCGLPVVALGPLRVGPAPVCAARRFPLAPPCGPGLAPRPGSSRPGAVRPGGRFCPPPPGVGLPLRRDGSVHEL